MQAKCPGCGKAMQIEEAHRGMDVSCPWCRQVIRVPAQRTPPPPARPPAPGRGQAPSRQRKGAAILRTCPNCGSKLPSGKSRCVECGVSYRAAMDARQDELSGDDGFAPERAAVGAGVLGGVILIVIAGVWFYFGYQAGRIFFYPPVLALIGVFAIGKGIADGNLAGGGGRRRSPRGPTGGRRPRRRR